MNVHTAEFDLLESHVSSLIHWLTLSAKIVRSYCRAIGLKQTQLNLIDQVDEASSLELHEDNSYIRDSDYATLVVLCGELTSPEKVKQAKFEFLSQTDQG